MNLSLMPKSAIAPESAPAPAPIAAPANGAMKIRPINAPQKAPDAPPMAVVLNNWFSLIVPSCFLTATTASPSSIKYSFCIEKSFSRTASAFSSEGNAITRRSLMPCLPCAASFAALLPT